LLLFGKPSHGNKKACEILIFITLPVIKIKLLIIRLESADLLSHTCVCVVIIIPTPTHIHSCCSYFRTHFTRKKHSVSDSWKFIFVCSSLYERAREEKSINLGNWTKRMGFLFRGLQRTLNTFHSNNKNNIFLTSILSMDKNMFI
jgi:hypothetical protein